MSVEDTVVNKEFCKVGLGAEQKCKVSEKLTVGDVDLVCGAQFIIRDLRCRQKDYGGAFGSDLVWRTRDRKEMKNFMCGNL